MEQAQSNASLVETLIQLSSSAWQPWLALAKREEGSSPLEQAKEAYQGNLAAGERLVNDVLRIQREWLRLGRQVAQNGPVLGSQPVQELAGSGFAAADELLEARAQLWEQWFAAARAQDIGQMAAVWQGMGGTEGRQDWLAVWQAMSERMLQPSSWWLSDAAAPAGGEEAAEPQAAEPPVADAKVTNKRVARVNARKTA